MASSVSGLTGFDCPIDISADFLPTFCKLAVFNLSLLV